MNAPFALRKSIIELSARERASVLFDSSAGRELLSPFDRIESPWLPLQGIAPQFDDGCVVMKGKIEGAPAVVVAVDGSFQGGSIGEVSGAKISATLDLARRDSQHGIRTNAVLFLETGGVRLQEANLGLAAVADVMASILDLRRYVPVICVITGPTGCFGGMAVAASLASYIIMTHEARLGMNGPEVIEQEAGPDEFDANDKELIWAVYGGESCYLKGLVDELIQDDVEELARVIRCCLKKGLPAAHRSAQPELFRRKIIQLEPLDLWNPRDLRRFSAHQENP